jgi:hypothetical protein
MKKFKPALQDWELCEILDEIWQAARTDRGVARQLARQLVRKVGAEFDLVTRKGVRRMRLSKRALAALIR